MDRGASGPVGLAEEFTLKDSSSAELPKTYKIAVDENGKPAWSEASGPENQDLDKVWELFPAGMGEAQDRDGGGYGFSRNVYHGRPGSLLPGPERKTLTLTGVTAKPTRFFEAASPSGVKYLYALAGTKAAKIRLSDMALMNVKDLSSAPVNFAASVYTGNGTTKVITGLGFTPSAVIVIKLQNKAAVIRTSTMTNTKLWTGTTIATGITSIDSDGFTVGAASEVNDLDDVYFYMAFQEASLYVDVGSYTGNNGANRLIADPNFQPDLVWVWDELSAADTAEVVSRHSSFTAVDQSLGYHDFAMAADEIRSFAATGFYVGANTRTNATGHTYHYLAIKQLANFCKVSFYDGNGAGDRDITGVGFDPQALILARYGTQKALYKNNSMGGAYSAYFSADLANADGVDYLITDGFNLSSGAAYNVDTIRYHYVAFRSMTNLTPVLGKPAFWNGLWHVPCGPVVSWKQLTTITDDTTDDTWTTATGLFADHFCVAENYLFEVVNYREIGKCSSPNTTVAGNWAHAYDVGQPGEKVTDLIAVGSELGVCTDRSYYRFDKVAVGRSQLDDAKPPADPDNGKGAFQFATWTLLPYSGYYRQVGEGVFPIGIDRIPLNTPLPFISYQPRFGKHGWTVGLGGWLYNIYTSATIGTYIMVAQIEGRSSLGVIWDPLFHSTTPSDPTILHIDSSKHLIWDTGYGVLTYIQLGADGSPEGGAFGNPSDNFYFYLGEISAGGALLQLREVEVEVRNGDANLAFQVGCYRDAGVYEGVEAAWDSNASTIRRVQWTPGTADTCYAVVLSIMGSMNAGFVPSATPPQIRRIRFRATVMAEQVHEIEVTILMNEGDERSVRQRFDDVRAMPGNGVHELRHPIRGDVEYVTVNQVLPTFVFQAGADQAEAAATLRMRRGDY